MKVELKIESSQKARGGLVGWATTALLTTICRLGWKCVSATILATDEGRALDLQADPPGVVADEVEEAVRTMRWKKVDTIFPGLLPVADEVCIDHAHSQMTAIIPCTGVVRCVFTKPLVRKLHLHCLFSKRRFVSSNALAYVTVFYMTWFIRSKFPCDTYIDHRRYAHSVSTIN